MTVESARSFDTHPVTSLWDSKKGEKNLELRGACSEQNGTKLPPPPPPPSLVGDDGIPLVEGTSSRKKKCTAARSPSTLLHLGRTFLRQGKLVQNSRRLRRRIVFIVVVAAATQLVLAPRIHMKGNGEVRCFVNKTLPRGKL